MCFLSHHLLGACRRGAGVGVRGHAVLGEDRFKLLQCGVGTNPRRVKMSPTHPEAGLGQVLKKLVQPVKRDDKHFPQTNELGWFRTGCTCRSRGDSLGHVHASDAVAVDAVIEGRVFQGCVSLELLYNISGLFSGLSFPCRKTQD